MKNILVPCDGSELSESAIPFAIGLARKHGGSVLLVRAVPEPLIVTDMPAGLRGAAEARAKAETEEAAARWKTDGVKILTRVRIAFPVEEILRSSGKCDAIVMTTHGHSGLKRFVLGSIAEKMIRLSPLPVLVIHPEAKRTRNAAAGAAERLLGEVVVPLDGSAAGEAALKAVTGLIDGKSRLHLLSVLPDGSGGAAREERTAWLDARAKKLEASGNRVVRFVLEGDSPAEVIARYAEKSGAGMIAMSRRGAGGIARWLMGSVTDRVIRTVQVPVLVVPARA